MSFTYSYLKWLIWGLEKPIVLTGAMHTMDEDPLEGIVNIEKSLQFLKAHEKVGTLGIIMGDSLITEGFPTKVSLTSKMPYKVFSTENTIWRNLRKNKRDLSFEFLAEKEIEVLVLTGVTPRLNYLNRIGDSLLLVIYGSGTFLHRKDITERIKAYRHKGKKVLAISQCLGEGVDFSKYEASLPLKELGVMEGSQMILEEAIGYLHSQG